MMTSNNSPYKKTQTRYFKQAKTTRARYRASFFALPFGFLFILLATIAILKNLHPKYSPYRLDEKTCLSQLNLNFLSASTICEHLVGQLDFSDFKIKIAKHTICQTAQMMISLLKLNYQS